jgi:uncharacterized protein
MNEALKSCLYQGEVMHHRLAPKRHRFVYRVTSWLIDLDELPRLHQSLKLFSHNRFNLYSIYERDYGDGSDRPLKQQILDLLKSKGLDTQDGPIRLLCYPRMLGYVFNPLSVFYCYDPDENLCAILYEVSNTFKQRHSYLIPVDAQATRTVRQACDKGFYVSPFMPMASRYHFRMTPPAEQVAVLIRQSQADRPLLDATFTGKRQTLSNRSLVRAFLRHPLMTLKVIVGIHWEALQLWRKGLRIQPQPAAPTERVSFITVKE